VDVAALSSTSPVGRPWRFTGTAMRPQTLLLCKLLFLLAAMHGLPAKLGDPYLPFLPILDALREVPGLFAAVLTTAYWVAGVALLFNAWARSAAVTLGATVILALLASKPSFQNHVFIVGCLFLLCGLHRRGEDPWLVRWQFVLMYFGAGLNKVLQADWWSGAFLHTWLHDHLANPLYQLGSALLPERWFAAGVSWAVMGSEVILFTLFLVRRWNRFAVWGVVVVHLGFFAVVGPGPFGYFTEDLLIGLLAFLAWPRGEQQLRLREAPARWARSWLFLLDWDRQLRVGGPPEDGHWLEVRDGASRYVDLDGLARLIRYSPAFWVALFGAYALALRIW